MSTKIEPELTFDGTGPEFTSLEEKIYRTIELLKHAREAKAAVERDVSRLREQLETREEEFDALKAEVLALKKDREEVRARVEKMLAQMDSLIEEEQA
jgi:chromosome segregation ATPase